MLARAAFLMASHFIIRAAMAAGLVAGVFAIHRAIAESPAAVGNAIDPQMQAVLDKLAEQGGKPLETLTPAEARKQPGPPDAMKAVLEANGKSVEPEPVADVKDLTFTSAGTKLPARVYKPEGVDRFRC